jgi:hypothetical protein
MATAEQKTRAEVYRDAAVEHVGVAIELYGASRFVLANYVAGLSAECMFRAYRHMIDPEFDSRHELGKLYQLAGFGDVVPSNRIEDVTAALGDVVACWSNDHRFLSLAALRKRWAKQKLFTRIKGDFVKEVVRRTVNAASLLVSIGEARWKSSFKE